VLGAAQDFSANAIEVAYQQARKSLYDLIQSSFLRKKNKRKVKESRLITRAGHNPRGF
jgi:hypothetical protein